MNNSKTRIKIISKLDEWYELISDSRYRILSINQSNPSVLQVVYCEKKEMQSGCNQTNIPLAAFVTYYAHLGEFGDELDGKYIKEFVAAGAKNYAKHLSDDTTECIVKGFQLSFLASLSVNFETIKNIVKHDNSKVLRVDQLKIRRNNKEWMLHTSIAEKEYGMVYDKRILYDDLTTRPYGYIEN